MVDLINAILGTYAAVHLAMLFALMIELDWPEAWDDIRFYPKDTLLAILLLLVLAPCFFYVWMKDERP